MKILFDLESGPLPLEQLAAIMPEFEASGTIKDPVKIEADIVKKRAAWMDKAALRATTGQVLALGWAVREGHFGEGETQTLIGEETEIIERFWAMTNAHPTKGMETVDHPMIGFYSNHFDLPFIIQRSRILGIKIPASVLTCYRGRWNLNERFVDLYDAWACGNRDCGDNLNTVARSLGLPGKLGSGGDFAQLLITDRAAAVAYLTRDIEIAVAVAERLGVL